MVAMNFDITAESNDAERAFRSLADEADRLDTKLDRLDGRTVKPTADMNIAPATAKIQQLQNRLAEIRNVRASVDLTGLQNARRDVNELVRDLRRLENRSVRLEVAGADQARRDVRQLRDDLRGLPSTTTVRLNLAGVNDAAFDRIENKLLAIRALSPLQVRLDVDPGDRARTRLIELTGYITALTRARHRIQFDADTGATRAALAALLAQVRALTAGSHDVRIRMQDQSLLGTLANIREELNRLAGHPVEIDANTEALMRALATARMELARLEAMDPTVRVQADVDDAQRAVRELEEELSRVALREHRAKVEVDIDKSLVGRLGAVSTSLAKVGAGGTLAAVGLAQVVPVVAGLVTLAQDLGGALPLAVGGLAQFQAVSLTVKAGAVGISDAFKAITDKDPEKFAAALKDMAPAGRDFARAGREVYSEWGKVRLDVQQHLMEGFGKATREVGSSYMPILRNGMVGVADATGDAGTRLAAYLTGARATGEVASIFASTRVSVMNLDQPLTNVVGGLLDVGEVGARSLTGLTSGLGVTTGKWREMIATAKDNGQLEAGVNRAIAVVKQLGDTAGNVGGIVGGIFTAAHAEQVDFVTRMQRGTQAVDDFVHSADGQDALRAFFSETRDTVDALTPGIESLAHGVSAAVRNFGETDGMVRFGSAASTVAQNVEPLVGSLGRLAGDTLGNLSDAAGFAGTMLLGPLAQGLSATIDNTGQLVPMATSMTAAFLGAKLIQPVVAGISTSMAAAATTAGTYALGMTGSATAGQAVANAGGAVAGVIGKVGAAMPLAAVAVVGLSMAYEALRSRATDSAKAVAEGSMTMQSVIAAEEERIKSRMITWDQAALNQEAATQAQQTATAAVEDYISHLGPVEQLQARVNMAQADYNQKVLEFGPASAQARDAAAAKQVADENLAGAQVKLKDGLGNTTAAMLDQQRAAMAGVDTDLKYQDSLARLADAQDRAAQAAKDHGAGSREADAANRVVTQSALDAAAAAGEKARADATAAGAANADEIAARAQKDELIRLAQQASGPTRQALLDAANGTNALQQAQNTAEVQARLHKDELGRLASQAQGPLAQAMRDARANFDTLGGAHATAEQKARAQKDELNRLAGMASGPVRTELQRMADQIRTLPNGQFTISAKGELSALTNHISQGGKTVASGGILPAGMSGPVQRYADGGITPGYTPGRDVHTFVSPTAGRLELSGGEGISRPEVTRALQIPGGGNGILGMNRAARTGGAPAVRKWLAINGPRIVGGTGGDAGRYAAGGVFAPRSVQRFALGGIVGGATPRTEPVQRFAMGGLVRAGVQPLNETGNRQYIQVRDEMMRRLAAQMVAERKKFAEAGGDIVGWARQHVGKPYQWGAVGPGSFDCSGFQSALTNHARGKANPYSRVGTTGSFPWSGFRSGYGPYTIGSSRSVNGGAGHMAGTAGGVNLESSGSVGVRVGGGARGANNGLFNTRAYLADRGGMIPDGAAALNLSGRAERMLTGKQNTTLERLTAAAEQIRSVSAPAGGQQVVGTVPAPGGQQVRVDVDVAAIVNAVQALGTAVRAAAQLAHEDAGGVGGAVRGSMDRVAAALRTDVSRQAADLRSSVELGRM